MIEAIYGLIYGILYSDWSMPKLEGGAMTEAKAMWQYTFQIVTHIFREGSLQTPYTYTGQADPLTFILAIIFSMIVVIFILRLIWSIVPRGRR